MASESFRVLDQFIGDGSVATYTSIEHTLALAGGRSASFLLTCTNYDDDTYLTLFLENSVNGKDFQSKIISYYTVSGVQYVNPVPILDRHKLVYTVSGVTVYPLVDTVVAAEPAPPLPNHRHARLRVQLMNDKGDTGKSARVVIDATIRGTPTVADDEAPARAAMPVGAPGSLTRHEQMVNEVQSLARASEALPQQHRAAYILSNLSSGSKEHVRAVERRLQALPPHVRGAVAGSVAEMTRRALALSGGARRRAPAEAPCCDPATTTVSKPKGSCGGGCG